MSWTDYMLMAAQHSRGNAQHWFRYLRKYINKCGTVFTEADVEALSHNATLSPFQRVSLIAAFSDGSPTRKHIISLNESGRKDTLSILKAERKGAEL